MHAAEVLPEEVLAVEVVVVNRLTVMGVDGCRAKVAAPETLLNVLCTDMSLPLVL